MTPLNHANTLLSEQRAMLEEAIRIAVFPETRRMAEHYLAKVAYWERQPDGARDLCLGEMGPNGYGPGIADVCRHAADDARIAACLARVEASNARSLQNCAGMVSGGSGRRLSGEGSEIARSDHAAASRSSDGSGTQAIEEMVG